MSYTACLSLGDPVGMYRQRSASCCTLANSRTHRSQSAVFWKRSFGQSAAALAKSFTSKRWVR